MASPAVTRQQLGGSIFFKLPLELRTMIYRELLTQSEPTSWWQWGPGVQGAHLAILRTCRAIHAEATPIFYGSFFFYIYASNGIYRSGTGAGESFYEGQLKVQAINYHKASPSRARLQTGILPNIHQIRKFHLHISCSQTKTPALFREHLDRAYSFLALAIEKGGRIDHLRLDVSKPNRGAYWVNHAVECVLGRLRGIRKVEIQEGAPMAMNGNGGTQTPWTRALETKMESKIRKQEHEEEQEQERVYKLLDMYWRLERSTKHITFLAPPLLEARKMAEKGDLQGFLDKRAFIVQETRLLFGEVESNLGWEPQTKQGEKRKAGETDLEEGGEGDHQALWKRTRPTYKREPLW